jgi:hypothetical protein
MLPCFHTTHGDVQFLLINQTLQLSSIELLTLESNRVSILHENLVDSEVTCINVNFKQFGEVRKLQCRGE